MFLGLKNQRDPGHLVLSELNECAIRAGAAVFSRGVYFCETKEAQESVLKEAKALGVSLEETDRPSQTIPRAHLLRAHILRASSSKWRWLP